MDSFQKCRIASERVSWNFADELGDLQLDFGKMFLPHRLCGVRLPGWLESEETRTLNHIRAFSYCHLFSFVEEFIIKQTCESATAYIHGDGDALSALLNFASEETKHQRMFELVKDLITGHLGHRPGELPGRAEVAQEVCSSSSFAVYLLTLMIEWLTQRHYVECFGGEDDTLDPGFVKIFRLHWTEEAMHARLDLLELEALVSDMGNEEVVVAVNEFAELLVTLGKLTQAQDELDLATFEEVTERTLVPERRLELLSALRQGSLWTFVLSGLEHKAFQRAYSSVVSAQSLSLQELAGRFVTQLQGEILSTHGMGVQAGTETPADTGVHQEESPGATGLTVLVVDDQPAIREFVRDVLARDGIEVVEAKDGLEALEAIRGREEAFSLVLLDLTMPGISGDEVLLILSREMPELPVVLSSGHMCADVLAEDLEGLMAGYLQKPYGVAALRAAVADTFTTAKV